MIRAAATFVGAFGIGLAVVWVTFLAPASGNRLPACAMDRAALLSETDLAHFIQMGPPQQASSLPFIGRDKTIGASFLGSISAGFVREEAVTGAFREGVGSPTSTGSARLPSVPLDGPIVAANLGPLEVYATVLAFRDRSGLDAFEALEVSNAANPYGLSINGEAPAASIGYDPAGDLLTFDREGPADGEHEIVIGIHHIEGTLDIQLAIRGGQDISVRDAEALEAVFVKRVAQACVG
jgi:hypothetical protein